MKNKNEIIEKINDKLSKFSESKLEKIDGYFENMPTDTSSNEHSPKIKKLEFSSELLEYFKSFGDKHGTSDLLLDLVERDFYELNKHLNFEDLSNVEVLRMLVTNICNNEYKSLYDIKNDVALSIYVEAKTQLELLGEDVADIISHYDFV